MDKGSLAVNKRKTKGKGSILGGFLGGRDLRFGRKSWRREERGDNTTGE